MLAADLGPDDMPGACAARKLDVVLQIMALCKHIVTVGKGDDRRVVALVVFSVKLHIVKDDLISVVGPADDIALPLLQDAAAKPVCYRHCVIGGLGNAIVSEQSRASIKYLIGIEKVFVDIRHRGESHSLHFFAATKIAFDHKRPHKAGIPGKVCRKEAHVPVVYDDRQTGITAAVNDLTDRIQSPGQGIAFWFDIRDLIIIVKDRELDEGRFGIYETVSTAVQMYGDEIGRDPMRSGIFQKVPVFIKP